MPARRRVGETPIARRTFDKIASSDGDDDDGAEAEADDDEDGSASLGAPGCATARARRGVVRRRLRAILSDLNARAGDAAARIAALIAPRTCRDLCAFRVSSTDERGERSREDDTRSGRYQHTVQ
jgi:hypothetical protein